MCVHVTSACREEAARMWAKREAEWDREKRAREKLMVQVLVERQEQLNKRMEDLRAKHVSSGNVCRHCVIVILVSFSV